MFKNLPEVSSWEPSGIANLHPETDGKLFRACPPVRFFHCSLLYLAFHPVSLTTTGSVAHPICQSFVLRFTWLLSRKLCHVHLTSEVPMELELANGGTKGIFFSLFHEWLNCTTPLLCPRLSVYLVLWCRCLLPPSSEINSVSRIDLYTS